MFANVQAWVMQPFKEQMDLFHWVLFIIVIMSIVYLWNDVLTVLE